MTHLPLGKIGIGITYLLSVIQTVMGLIYIGIYVVLGPPQSGVAGDASQPMAFETAVALVSGGLCLLFVITRLDHDFKVEELTVVNRCLAESLGTTNQAEHVATVLAAELAITAEHVAEKLKSVG